MDLSSEQVNVLAVNMNGNKQNDDRLATAQYTMPGIMHFLQTEWARFETDRAQWEIDRAELQAKVAFLQGERKGQENLKVDLVRRIKMLEYALKQERCKYHKLKYGTDLELADMIPPNFEKDFKDSASVYNNNNGTWKHGRQLLRQYLQEIGYTDTIIDVRSARIRQMLGLPPSRDSAGETKAIAPAEVVTGKRPIETQGNGSNIKKMPTTVASSAVSNGQDAIMASFDFLGNENIDEEDDDDGDVVSDIDNGNDMISAGRQQGDVKAKVAKLTANSEPTTLDDETEIDTEDALAEFDFLGSAGSEDVGKMQRPGNKNQLAMRDSSPNEEWNVDEQMITDMRERFKQERRKDRKTLTALTSDRPSKSALKAMLENLHSEENLNVIHSRGSSQTNGNVSIMANTDEDAHNVGISSFRDNDDIGQEPSLGLGELADLSVTNEIDSTTYDNTGPCDMQRKTWTAKYTLRSHFDGIRAVVFHPIEEVVITAGEDHVLKLWNLQKTAAAKKTALLDVEPSYTLRGHSGPVLSLAMNPTGEFCYSGGIDGTICCWNVPNLGIDPYDAYDPSVLHSRLLAHTDAVWGLSMHGAKSHLLSCSADGTVRLWNPAASHTPLLNTFRLDEDKGIPTSIDFVNDEPNRMLAAYSTNVAYVFDMEHAKPLVTLDYTPSADHTSLDRINRILSHPTLPVTITAHEDRHLRFFDNNTGKLIHSMVAHLDAVTSIAVDQSGLYVLSGSHDCSIRLWNLETKTCIQELTSHRKKFDESIHDVAFHPSRPFFASAGADGLVKVYV
jgi:striatin 1/3/4